MVPAIFALAWPTMLEQLMQTAVQYIDTAMVGSLGTYATAAVGATTTVNWLIGSTISALGVGFLSYIARACGAGEQETKVQQDVLELPIDVVHTISFFFSNQLHLFLLLFPFYLIQQIEKMEMPMEKKEMLIKSIKEMDSLNLESFHTFLNIAK